MCFFSHPSRHERDIRVGRFRSANPSAAGLLDLNFRISDTHLQQIEIGPVEPGQLHWMEAMKFASSKHWRAPPETDSPLSNPTTYDGVRSLW
jgi:hypothetical protein